MDQLSIGLSAIQLAVACIPRRQGSPNGYRWPLSWRLISLTALIISLVELAGCLWGRGQNNAPNIIASILSLAGWCAIVIRWSIFERSRGSHVYEPIVAEESSPTVIVAEGKERLLLGAVASISIISDTIAVYTSITAVNIFAIAVESFRLLAVFALLIATIMADSGSRVSPWKRMTQLLPFVWPKGHLALQFMLFACISLLVFERVVNLMVPVQYKVQYESRTLVVK